MPLIISILSLSLAILNLIRLQKCLRQETEYIKKLKETQIKIYEIYNFIRMKRNNILNKKTKFENEYFNSFRWITRYANRVCLFTACKEEKLINEIEDYIRKRGLI